MCAPRLKRYVRRPEGRAAIRKRANVRYTFGGEEPRGWLPQDASRPKATPEHTVDLLVEINDAGNGVTLQWTGPKPEFSGDRWYEELANAEEAAREIFGIKDSDWRPAV